MDVYEAMAARKTIRDFSPQPIEAEVIRRLIAADFNAPSNNHLRQWHFVLLQDCQRRKELLDQVIDPVGRKGAIGIVNRWQITDPVQREMYIEGIPRQYSMLMNCACLMLPFFEQTTPLLKPKDLSALNAFASIWCVVENILVAAASEGIFGVTRIPFEKEREVIKAYVEAPEGYEIPCYIALGTPADGVQRARQMEINLDERIHSDRW